ncbi:O-antigen acetylase [Caballeronia fortuita]|uniref:O-antigen acetylase n=1 Tax=Caballeronia fortuita TaxID=1777138 RepID=A0A158DDN2_9BURK|nr:acyltransferase [Caballeronia fortuita]SAK92631.1 O-antigen acetylase [Caballeronia fortuita]
MASSNLTKTGRAHYLDSLRGFAAVSVMLSHLVVAGYNQLGWIWTATIYSPVRILIAGHQAVILFFVLSGFALTRMIDGMNPYSYLRYFAARVVRLYPPYVASLILAVLVYFGLERLGFQWTDRWMYTVHPQIDKNIILEHALLVGPLNVRDINPVIWSIAMEMRISIAFPIILFLVRRFGLYAVVAMMMCSLAIGPAVPWANAHYSSYVSQTLLTMHYSTFFFIGCWLSFNVDRLRSRIPQKHLVAVWCFALALYAYPFFGDWEIIARVCGDVAVGVGAALLVILCSTVDDNAFLRIGRWLGKYSYSLYLNHILVLFAAIIVFYRTAGSVVVWCVTIPAALLLAMLMHKLFEWPAVLLSRKIVRGFSPRRAVTNRLDA